MARKTTNTVAKAAAMPALPGLDALKWRCIGPSRGGRVVAVSGDPKDRMTFYFGACAGGVWKTVDGGVFSVDPATGEARITFHANKPVKSVAKFAVSLERKGGVPKAEGPMVLLSH